MDDTLQDIANYLTGHRLMARTDDPRRWADYLREVIQPQLDELAALKAKKEKGKAA